MYLSFFCVFAFVTDDHKKAPVTKPPPYRAGKAVGAVAQSKENANVEWGEVEIAKHLTSRN